MKISKVTVILLAVISHFNSISIKGQAPTRENFNFVFENNFNDDVLGRYQVTDYVTDFSPQPVTIPPQSHMDIIDDSDPKHNKFMRGYFPQGTYLPDQHGYLFFSYLKNPVTELYFSYDVRLKPGFNYVKGGKIPGLTGGKVVSGVKPSTTDGFSTRMMWTADGRLVFYVYHQDQEIIYGSSYYWGNFVFTTGKWYNLTIRVVLNTVNNGIAANDGILEGFIDGKLMFQKKDFKFRSLSSILIDNMYIVSFFGGNTPDFATTRDEWIDTDNFVAFTYSNSAANVPRGHQVSSAQATLLHPYLMGTSIPAESNIPNAPSSFTNLLLSKSSASFTWTDNSTDEEGFKIYRSLSSTSGFSEVGNLAANVTSFTDNTLQPGTIYYYRILAYNQNGNSSYTPIINITTSLLDLPSAPSELTSTSQTSSTIDLSWKDNSSREQGFKLYRSESASAGFAEVATCEANETSCTDRSLLSGKTYFYKLRAFNVDGFSEYTAVINASTKQNTGTTIYIDPDNNEMSSDGTIQHPYDSWSDVVWKEGYTYLQKKGTSSNISTLQIGANNVVLGSYGEGELPVLTTQSTNYLINGFNKSGIVIRDLNLKATNAVSCIYFLGSSSNLVIEHCILQGNLNAIKAMDGTSLSIKYNRIRSGEEGIFSTAASNDICYNIFEECNTAVNIMASSAIASIFNNVFVANTKSVSVSNAELVLYNNIFYLTEPGNVALSHGTGKISSDNNIFFPEQQGFISIGGKSFSSLNTLKQQLKIDTKSFAKDPVFMDLSNKNYHLDSKSPAINTGKNLSLNADFEGTKVPLFETADIGAFEFNGDIDISIPDSENFSFKVFPNPSNGYFTIEGQIAESLLQDEHNVRVLGIDVLDVTGKIILSKNFNMSSTTFQDNIDLSDYKNGLYFVVVQAADKVLKQKVLISR